MSEEYIDEDYPEDYPCDNCGNEEFCDHWEARFCCTLCRYNGREDCDNCDPMDI